MQLNIVNIQRFIPASVKFALKPYYRTFYPNKLHVIMNPTWRCNYSCSYCPIVTKFAYTKVVDKKGERKAAEWIQGLDKLPPAVIYIAGGEPFVYAELADLINGMPEKHALHGIVTNLSLHENAYRKIRRKMHLNASFHREHIAIEAFLAKVKALSDNFHIHVNIVATPENLLVLDQVAEEIGGVGVTLHVDPLVEHDFQYSPSQLEILRRHLTKDRSPRANADFEDFSPKRCSAGRNYVNFTPDGSAYTCYGGMNFVHSTLYEEIARGRDLSDFRMGNLFDSGFSLRSCDMMCSMPCTAACDRDAAVIKPMLRQ